MSPRSGKSHGICARCQRMGVKFATTWPEGRICRRCYQRATRIHGECRSCGTTRLLPGLIEGSPACVDCTEIPKDFHCTRCGREDEPVRRGLCAHCCLTDDLTALLAVMSGQVVDSADGRGSDCGVVPVMIVEVQPAG